MTKASRSTARVRPIPKSLMKLTSEVAKARNTTEMSTAAAVTIPPVRSKPRATERTLSDPRSCSSLILDSRNTS
jgi:hypothetical protein